MNTTTDRIRRIAESAARAGVSIHPRYILDIINEVKV